MKKATKSDLAVSNLFALLSDECMFNITGGCSSGVIVPPIPTPPIHHPPVFGGGGSFKGKC